MNCLKAVGFMLSQFTKILTSIFTFLISIIFKRRCKEAFNPVPPQIPSETPMDAIILQYKSCYRLNRHDFHNIDREKNCYDFAIAPNEQNMKHPGNVCMIKILRNEKDPIEYSGRSPITADDLADPEDICFIFTSEWYQHKRAIITRQLAERFENQMKFKQCGNMCQKCADDKHFFSKDKRLFPFSFPIYAFRNIVKHKPGFTLMDKTSQVGAGNFRCMYWGFRKYNDNFEETFMKIKLLIWKYLIREITEHNHDVLFNSGNINWRDYKYLDAGFKAFHYSKYSKMKKIIFRCIKYLENNIHMFKHPDLILSCLKDMKLEPFLLADFVDFLKIEPGTETDLLKYKKDDVFYTYQTLNVYTRNPHYQTKSVLEINEPEPKCRICKLLKCEHDNYEMSPALLIQHSSDILESYWGDEFNFLTQNFKAKNNFNRVPLMFIIKYTHNEINEKKIERYKKYVTTEIYEKKGDKFVWAKTIKKSFFLPPWENERLKELGLKKNKIERDLIIPKNVRIEVNTRGLLSLLNKYFVTDVYKKNGSKRPIMLDIHKANLNTYHTNTSLARFAYLNTKYRNAIEPNFLKTTRNDLQEIISTGLEGLNEQECMNERYRTSNKTRLEISESKSSGSFMKRFDKHNGKIKRNKKRSTLFQMYIETLEKYMPDFMPGKLLEKFNAQEKKRYPNELPEVLVEVFNKEIQGTKGYIIPKTKLKENEKYYFQNFSSGVLIEEFKEQISSKKKYRKSYKTKLKISSSKLPVWLDVIDGTNEIIKRYRILRTRLRPYRNDLPDILSGNLMEDVNEQRSIKKICGTKLRISANNLPGVALDVFDRSQKCIIRYRIPYNKFKINEDDLPDLSPGILLVFWEELAVEMKNIRRHIKSNKTKLHILKHELPVLLKVFHKRKGIIKKYIISESKLNLYKNDVPWALPGSFLKGFNEQISLLKKGRNLRKTYVRISVDDIPEWFEVTDIKKRKIKYKDDSMSETGKLVNNSYKQAFYENYLSKNLPGISWRKFNEPENEKKTYMTSKRTELKISKRDNLPDLLQVLDEQKGTIQNYKISDLPENIPGILFKMFKEQERKNERSGESHKTKFKIHINELRKLLRMFLLNMFNENKEKIKGINLETNNSKTSMNEISVFPKMLDEEETTNKNHRMSAISKSKIFENEVTDIWHFEMLTKTKAAERKKNENHFCRKVLREILRLILLKEFTLQGNIWKNTSNKQKLNISEHALQDILSGLLATELDLIRMDKIMSQPKRKSELQLEREKKKLHNIRKTFLYGNNFHRTQKYKYKPKKLLIYTELKDTTEVGKGKRRVMDETPHQPESVLRLHELLKIYSQIKPITDESPTINQNKSNDEIVLPMESVESNTETKLEYTTEKKMEYTTETIGESAAEITTKKTVRFSI